MLTRCKNRKYAFENYGRLDPDFRQAEAGTDFHEFCNIMTTSRAASSIGLGLGINRNVNVIFM